MIRCDIAVVGGGFSGSILAARLAGRATAGLSVRLFEPGDVGRGAAYGTRHAEHLLNTRAQAMSAFSDDPDHFVRWLGARGGASDFMPRRLYGDYLEEIARQTFDRPGICVTAERVRAIARARGGGFAVVTGSGARFEARTVVLATGNAAPSDDFLPREMTEHPRYVRDPWRFDYRAVEGTVVLIGSGLTALDALVALESSGHRGTVHVVSRRGRFPEVHADVAPYDVTPALDATSARTLLHSFRRHVRDAAERGFDWRAVVDAVRGESEALWRRLPPAERERFERRLRVHWERHRHRAPQSADAVRERCRRSGRLRAYAGRIEAMRRGQVTIRLSAGGRVGIFADWLINCSGLGRNHRLLADPLLAGLVSQGIVSPEPLGLGIRVDGRLAVLDSDGKRVGGLWAVGPLVRGGRFEATAVPELRTMVETVAGELHGALRRHVKRDNLLAGASWGGTL